MTAFKQSGGDALARAVEQIYAANGGSEYGFEPMNLYDGDRAVGLVRPGDGVIFCCRRGERETELTDAFTDPNFKGFERKMLDPLDFVILTMYSERYTYLPIAQLRHALRRQFDDLAGTELLFKDEAKLFICERLERDRVTVVTSAHGDGDSPQPVSCNDKRAVLSEGQDGSRTFDRLLRKADALRKVSLLVNQRGQQLDIVDPAAGFGVKVYA